MPGIRYIKHSEIDFLKWDHLINQSPNGLIYAYSWFLNQMAPGWEALVLGDYEVVMPLTKRKKWGIEYLYQPSFCAELGVFGREIPSNELVNEMLKHIPKNFRYIDICLNRNNVYPLSEYPFTLRRNTVLSLKPSYQEIEKKMSLNHRRNIKKAEKNGLRWVDNVSVEQAVLLAKEVMSDIAEIPRSDWQNFIDLFKNRPTDTQAVCVGVENLSGELLSSAVLFYSRNAWYYLLAGTTKKGKKTGAAHLLINEFIRRNASSGTYLDFEGSDVDSVAFFYKGFGAVEVNYPALRLNRLPALIKWLKR
jgi:hypothetical protein